MKKILILGVTGLIGRAIVGNLSLDYEIYGLSRNEDKQKTYKHIIFDLEKDNIQNILTDVEPDYIISCTRGSYDKQLKTHQQIADYAKRHHAIVYYFSTANVFDGDPTCIKYEDDTPCAESDYGKFKIECENILLNTLDKNVVIIRLPMVFGSDSTRVNHIRSSVKSSGIIKVFNNMIMTSIYDTDLALEFRYIIKENLKGIFHFASKDSMNHKEFYKKIVSKTIILDGENILDYETYYLAIQAKRKELDFLSFTNDDVIKKIKYCL